MPANSKSQLLFSHAILTNDPPSLLVVTSPPTLALALTLALTSTLNTLGYRRRRSKTNTLREEDSRISTGVSTGDGKVISVPVGVEDF